MRIDFKFTPALVCALIAIGASSMRAEEFQKQQLKQQIHERRVAYRDALQKAFDCLHLRYIEGAEGIGCVSKTRFALLEADLAIESESGQRLRKIEAYVSATKQEEHDQNVRFKMGSLRTDELYLSVADRIHGEIMLLQEQERQQNR